MTILDAGILRVVPKLVGTVFQSSVSPMRVGIKNGRVVIFGGGNALIVEHPDVKCEQAVTVTAEALSAAISVFRDMNVESYSVVESGKVMRVQADGFSSDIDIIGGEPECGVIDWSPGCECDFDDVLCGISASEVNVSKGSASPSGISLMINVKDDTCTFAGVDGTLTKEASCECIKLNASAISGLTMEGSASIGRVLRVIRDSFIVDSCSCSIGSDEKNLVINSSTDGGYHVTLRLLRSSRRPFDYTKIFQVDGCPRYQIELGVLTDLLRRMSVCDILTLRFRGDDLFCGGYMMELVSSFQLKNVNGRVKIKDCGYSNEAVIKLQYSLLKSVAESLNIAKSVHDDSEMVDVFLRPCESGDALTKYSVMVLSIGGGRFRQAIAGMVVLPHDMEIVRSGVCR